MARKLTSVEIAMGVVGFTVSLSVCVAIAYKVSPKSFAWMWPEKSSKKEEKKK